MVEKKLLANCPVTRQDIMATEHIFGPDEGCLKGKMVRRAPHTVRTDPVGLLPVDIMSRYRKVVLCVDIMYVNKVPFLMTVSRHIKLGTAERLVNRKEETVLAAIMEVCKTVRRGWIQGRDHPGGLRI